MRPLQGRKHWSIYKIQTAAEVLVAHSHSLCTSIQRPLDDIRCWTSDSDDGGDAKSGNGRDGVVHRVIANVTVFAIDDDAIESGEGDNLSHPYGWKGHEGHQRVFIVLELVQKP